MAFTLLPGIILITSHTSSFNNLQQPCHSHSGDGKSEAQKIKPPASGHTVGKWQSWELQLGSLATEYP